MSADETRIDALAGSLSDDRPVDWKAESDAAVGEAGADVRALRDIAAIADFNRRLQREPDIEPSAATSAVRDAQQWGHLLLLEPLGAGRHGEVWRCWDLRLHREVALKWLRASGSEIGAQDGSALTDEARALARVSAPGVVCVYGIDEHDGRLGMWMELLRGETLAESIARRGRLPAAEVAAIGRSLARALEVVHAAGLVHRDIKPANVMLESSGRVVLTDFGLGTRRGFPEAPLARLSGTPLFMSPERLAGGSSTPSSDLYALGATLWCALAGQPPFEASTLDALREEATRGPARSLATECPGAPPFLVRAIERAMSPAPAHRFATAAEMSHALDHAEAGGRAPARSRALAIAAAIAIAVIAAVWMFSSLRSREAAVAARVRPDAAGAAPATYDVDASLVRRTGGRYEHLSDGDRVSPGDRLSLEFRASRRTWVYVLNEDERGQSFLLFPARALERTNPLSADSTNILPGPVDGRENGWIVTSRGGREHFLVVASPEPVAALEAELGRVPDAEPGRRVRDDPAPASSPDPLRGVGGIAPLGADPGPRRAGTLERFARLAGRETGVRGTWVREVTLVNPTR
jgi:Protein kinase domain/Domain of unknown function (DUF4384)